MISIAAVLGRVRRRRVGQAALSVGQMLAPATGGLLPLVAVFVAGVETWGAYLAAAVLVRLLAHVANFGSRDYLLRVVSGSPASLEVAWRRNAIARSVLLALGPVAFLVAGFEPWAVATLTLWLAALFLSQSYDAVIVYRRAFGLGLILEAGSSALLVVAMLLAGSALTAGLLIALSTVVAALRAGVLVGRFGMLARPRRAPTTDLGELRASWGFFLLTFTGMIQGRVDLYVVAALLSPAALGTYGLLTSFVQVAQSLSAALLAPIAPQLYRLRPARILVVAGRLAAAGVVIVGLALAGTWVVMELAYRLPLTGETYAAAALAMLPPFIYAPLVYLWFRRGRPGIVVAGALLGTIVGLVVALALVPRLGIGGAMLAAAAGQASIAAFHVAGAVRLVRRPVVLAGAT